MWDPLLQLLKVEFLSPETTQVALPSFTYSTNGAALTITSYL